MNSFFQSGPLPDWKELQRLLGKDMPWKLMEKWDQGDKDSNWLNEYVKDILKKSQTQPQTQTSAHNQSLIRMDAEKNARYVNVTIWLTPETNLRGLQLFASADRLKLTGLPGDKKRAIRFPCLVYPRSGKAVLKDNKITVRFKRRPPLNSEYELFIGS